MSYGSAKKPLPGQDCADLADRVEEQGSAPVLDEELVALRVREHVAAEPDHLLNCVRSSSLDRSSHTRRDPLALGEHPRAGPVELPPVMQLRDVARDRGERQARVVRPRAMVVVEAVAGRHDEPGMLRASDPRAIRVRPRSPELLDDLLVAASCRRTCRRRRARRRPASAFSSSSGRHIVCRSRRSSASSSAAPYRGTPAGRTGRTSGRRRSEQQELEVQLVSSL